MKNYMPDTDYWKLKGKNHMKRLLVCMMISMFALVCTACGDGVDNKSFVAESMVTEDIEAGVSTVTTTEASTKESTTESTTSATTEKSTQATTRSTTAETTEATTSATTTEEVTEVQVVTEAPTEAATETVTTAEVVTEVPTTQAVTEAPVTTEAVQESIPVSSGTTYVLNTNTFKFHYPYCSSVDEMSPKNRLEVDWSREDVINAGYVPCKRCDP